MIPLAWEEIEKLALGNLEGAPEDGVVRRIHDECGIPYEYRRLGDHGNPGPADPSKEKP